MGGTLREIVPITGRPIALASPALVENVERSMVSAMALGDKGTNVKISGVVRGQGGLGPARLQAEFSAGRGSATAAHASASGSEGAGCCTTDGRALW